MLIPFFFIIIMKVDKFVRVEFFIDSKTIYLGNVSRVFSSSFLIMSWFSLLVGLFEARKIWLCFNHFCYLPTPDSILTLCQWEMWKWRNEAHRRSLLLYNCYDEWVPKRYRLKPRIDSPVWLFDQISASGSRRDVRLPLCANRSLSLLRVVEIWKYTVCEYV